MISIRTAAAFLTLPCALAAQAVHGTVLDRGGIPVPGVVVLLVDGASAQITRALTSNTGYFRLASPRAGTYRIRTLRIGYRPVLSEPFSLAIGEDLAHNIELSGLPVALDTMRVSSRNQCHTVGDSGGATFRVWEQIRSALMATDLTSAARVINASTVEYSRTLDPKGRVTAQSSNIKTEYVTQPWHGLSQDSLHRFGYVTSDALGWTTYYGPGIETLLSQGFVADHCFHLVTNRTQLGIAFEPGSDRDNTAELRGTLWLDRASAELRSLEFQYVNIPQEQADRARGRVGFARTRNGIWLISGWDIEMPLIARIVHEPMMLRGMTTPGFVETTVTEVRVQGGELVSARQGNDTVWTGPPWRLRGVVSDSVSDAPIDSAHVRLLGTDMSAVTDAAGRFVIDRVLPGRYTLQVRTSSLDAVSAENRISLSFTDSEIVHVRVPSADLVLATACKASGRPGIIIGTVATFGDSAAVAGLEVEARWRTPHLTVTPGAAVVSQNDRSVTTQTDKTGHFTLCDVPREQSITVFVVGDTTIRAPAYIPLDGRLARTEFTLTRPVAKAGARRQFSGTVVTDKGQTALSSAEVSVPEMDRVGRTDEKGAFSLGELPVGATHVVVRHLGYAPIDTTIITAKDATAQYQFVMRTVQTLDSIATTSTGGLPRDFYDNMHVGLGHFLTRADLDKTPDARLSAVLAGLPGTKLVGGMHSSWLVGGHGVVSMGCASNSCFRPNPEDVARGARVNCYALVFLDGIQVFRGRTAPLSDPRAESSEPLFDLNSLIGRDVAGIEYYDGAAQTPLKYSTLNSQCGVLVIWTRGYERPQSKPEAKPLTPPVVAAVTRSQFSGTVLTEKGQTALSSADVSLPELGQVARTDDKGSFTLGELPPGATHIVVRHLGFAPVDTTITISSGAPSRYEFLMTSVQTLDSIKTSAAGGLPPEFYEHMRLRLGHFLTRDDLERMGDARLSAILSTVPGTKFMGGGMRRTFMIGRHEVSTGSGSASFFRPNTQDQLEGGEPGCYSLVYLDGLLVFGRRPSGGARPVHHGNSTTWEGAEPLFDLNTLSGQSIQGIEYYDGASQTPLKYSTLSSECGVLVIWTRKGR